MHEFSVAQGILDTIEQVLGGKRELVTATLTIGVFSGISPDAMEFCFTELADEKGFGRPRLIINERPAAMHCNHCQSDYEARDASDPCPHCGSFDRRLLGGRECTIDSVEIKESPDE